MTPGARDLWLLPLGGCGEIGINLNLYGHDGQWLMVDCGIGFERSGTNTVVFTAAADFIASRRDRLLALLVTHAHEDHVGAVAHHWPQLRCPVYCTPFTAEILSRKLAEAGLADAVPVRVVQPGQRHQLGSFDVQWVHLTHSTPESHALFLRTPAGRVLHTGDWKLDPAPVVGPGTNPAALRGIGDEGVLAMVCDSTNATVPGRSVSEGDLYAGLLEQVCGATGRVVIGCFGSNVARLVTLARVAQSAQRYTGLLGRSLEHYYRAAHRANLWPAELSLAQADHLGYLPRHEVFAVATGSQGETNAALARLARGSHPAFELEPGDRVIFSARVIPGNEEELARLQAQFEAMGVQVVTEANSALHIHASGHPARDELADMYRWIRPEIAVPVHGTPRHLDAHAELAKQLGVPRQLNGRNGDLFMLSPQPGIRRGAASVGRVILDR
jgi:ribonuclease J